MLSGVFSLIRLAISNYKYFLTNLSVDMIILQQVFFQKIMKLFPLYFLFAICFLSSKCNKTNLDTTTTTVAKDTLVTSIKPLWSLVTSNDKTWNDGFDIAEPVIYGQNVLVSTILNKYQVFRMLNSQTGSEVWNWQDFFRKLNYDSSNYSIRFPYIKTNKMVWSSFNEIYSIDLETGNTIWKNLYADKYGFQCKGVADNFFIQSWSPVTGNNLGPGDMVYNGNLITGSFKFLTIPKYDTTDVTPNNGRTGVILGTAPFINSSGDTMLIISYADQPVTKDYLFRDAFGVYNFSKNKWQIERVPIGLPSITGINFTPIVKDGKVFHCKVGLVTCHDVNTGELLWSYNQIGNANFLFSGILVANGKVFANAGNGVLHCIEIATGKPLWQTESAGSCSDMAYLNGIIYFVGGSDGLLHAVDETKGKTIWKVISPDDGKAINKISGTFTRFCAVVPGVDGTKGRIVTHTGYNIYCFEAAK